MLQAAKRPHLGLASKTEGLSQPDFVAYPDMLDKIVAAVLDPAHATALGGELPGHPYAGPFLQALLQAVRGNKCASICRFYFDTASHPQLWN